MPSDPDACADGRVGSLFCRLHAARFSGEVHIEGGGEQLSVVFHMGNPAFVEDQSARETLSRHFVDRGLLSEAALNEVVAHAGDALGSCMDMAFCARVVELGRVPAEQATLEAMGWVRTRILRAMRWPDCIVDLDPTVVVPPSLHAWSQPVGPLVYMGVRTFYGQSDVDAVLGDEATSTVYFVAPVEAAVDFFGLDEDEEALLRACSPHCSVQDFLRRSPEIDVLQAWHLLLLLRFAGFIDLSPLAVPASDGENSGVHAMGGGRPARAPTRPPSQPMQREPAAGARPPSQPMQPAAGARPPSQPMQPAAGARPPSQPMQPAAGARPPSQPMQPAAGARPPHADSTKRRLSPLEAAAAAGRARAASRSTSSYRKPVRGVSEEVVAPRRSAAPHTTGAPNARAVNRLSRELEKRRPQTGGRASTAPRGASAQPPAQSARPTTPARNSVPSQSEAHLKELVRRRMQRSNAPSSGGGQDAEQLLLQARGEMAREQYDRAVELMVEACRADADNTLYRGYLLWARFRRSGGIEHEGEDASELRTIAKEFFANEEHMDFACHVIGHLAYAAEDYDKAEKYLRKAMQANRRNRDAERYLRIVERRKQKPDEPQKFLGIELSARVGKK